VQRFVRQLRRCWGVDILLSGSRGESDRVLCKDREASVECSLPMWKESECLGLEWENERMKEKYSYWGRSKRLRVGEEDAFAWKNKIEKRWNKIDVCVFTSSLTWCGGMESCESKVLMLKAGAGSRRQFCQVRGKNH
jgi:hypothetical protein